MKAGDRPMRYREYRAYLIRSCFDPARVCIDPGDTTHRKRHKRQNQITNPAFFFSNFLLLLLSTQ
jgi:hypothetical protein